MPRKAFSFDMQACSNRSILASSQQRESASALLSLPADTRNIIYNLVFQEPDGIHIDFTNHQSPKGTLTVFALALTCREIYHETSLLPYWLNIFHFHVPILQDMETILATAIPPDKSPVSQGWHVGSRKEGSEVLPLCKTTGALEQKSEEFVSMATQSPHAKDLANLLANAVNESQFVSRLRKIHIHLGSQINNTFVEKFFRVWHEVEDPLRKLSTRAQLRISFELRLSRRLIVEYDFQVAGPEKTLSDMDCCVTGDAILTLPEVSTINAVRMRLWRTFFQPIDVCTKPAAFRINGRRGIFFT